MKSALRPKPRRRESLPSKAPCWRKPKLFCLKGGPCRREVVFSVATHEAEMVVSRLAAVGLHGTAQPHSQGSARVSVASPDLWSLCRTMGKGAAGKSIPSAFHAASREWQAAFLDGYFTGDGSYYNRCNESSWDLTEAQARGVDAGSTVATLPTVDEIVALAHAILGF